MAAALAVALLMSPTDSSFLPGVSAVKLEAQAKVSAKVEAKVEAKAAAKVESKSESKSKLDSKAV